MLDTRDLLSDHAFFGELHGPVRITRIPYILRHQADRCSVAVEVLQQLHHGFAIRGVEVPRRLVAGSPTPHAPPRPGRPSYAT